MNFLLNYILPKRVLNLVWYMYQRILYYKFSKYIGLFVVCYSPQQEYATYQKLVSITYRNYPKTAIVNIHQLRHIGIRCRSDSLSAGVYTEIYKFRPIIHVEKVFIDSKVMDAYIKDKLKKLSSTIKH